jgi:hypothetical protein
MKHRYHMLIEGVGNLTSNNDNFCVRQILNPLHEQKPFEEDVSL